jgi:ketosteroid isomerase-like protein
MPSPAEVVERYFDAWTAKDFDTARSLLRDDLSFKGPIEQFDSADALMESIKQLTEIVTGAERNGIVEQGDQVCVIYDLHTVPIPTAPVAEWYTVRDGKIASLQAFFDARPFAAMFEQQHA